MAVFPSEAMHALLARNCQSLLGAHGHHALGEKHVARFGLLALQTAGNRQRLGAQFLDPLLCSTSDRPHKYTQGSGGLFESCSKNGDVPKSPFRTVAAVVPSAGTKAF